ncbi:hypothetical protein ACGFNU_41955 [Spirillospora sp. NPDC048911]|uniref:hypothetical protein n=1 Tax=Spirillospora sp. NPDC048911 TaxID=3364527 RepID=UPI003711D792
MADNKISVLDYELYIIQTMKDAPEECVDAALQRAGVDRARMERSYHIVDQQNFAVRPAYEEKSRILGPPVREGVREIHGREAPMRSFFLPLWEDFLLDIYATPDGRVWDERFSRAPGRSAARASKPSGLKPWSFTKEEVKSQFSELEDDELWPPYESASLRYRGPDGKHHVYEVIFSWGLLQDVNPIEP